MRTTEPNNAPGSPAARNVGCTCPMLDNAHGRGCGGDADGVPVYWIVADCPLHGEQPARIAEAK